MVSIEQLYNHLKTLTSQWFYTKAEIDTSLEGKVDVVSGKGLSTEDYTTAEKTKLAGIETEANKTIVDSSFVANSENPVQSKVVKSALDGKVDVVSGKGLSTEDYTTEEKTKLAGIEAEANKTIVDSSLSSSSENPVQNKAVKAKFDLVDADIATKATAADLHAVATSGSYTDLENIPSTFAPSAHEHFASEVKDAAAYTNLGTSANATQSAINYAIDTKIGSLLAVELIEVASSLPTASASTMNKLYLVPESTSKTNDNYEIYVTVEDDGSYTWEKVDTARIDLSNYVTTDDPRLSDARTPVSHTHGNITNDGKIGSTSGKVVVTGDAGALTVSTMVDEMDGVVNQLINYGNSL